jgi:tRNA (guanine9-N1)-methyltransferase
MSHPLISADEISEGKDDTMGHAEGTSGSQQPFAEIEEPGDGDGNSTHPKPMSKKAMKKAAKAERIAATKLERRAREKEAKKVKKRILAEKRAAGELNEEDEEETRRRAKRAKIDFAGKVVVDLGFDEMMSDKVS